MHSRILSFFILMGLVLSLGCQTPLHPMLEKSELVAWCIVPFDSLNRTPSERMEMLHDLGLKKYAYDWRAKDLDDFAEEIEVAKKENIEMSAVWLWIDGNHDVIDTLSETNEKMLAILQKSGLKTDVWLSFHDNFFDVVHHTARVAKGSRMIRYIADKVEGMGCRLALYNHGAWFGEPLNQIKIIDKLQRDIGLIYNFHHAHEQLDRYSEMVPTMLPYLWMVNLNGMSMDGPKIMPLGQGELEKKMIKELVDAGYQGQFGILGHVADADVYKILKANLEGLEKLAHE